MQNIIKNNWSRELGAPFTRAKILDHDVHPEGLDIDRLRFIETGNLSPKSSVGNIISVLQGRGTLKVAGADRQTFTLGSGVHLYLPPGLDCILEAGTGDGTAARLQPINLADARQATVAARRDIYCGLCHGIPVTSVDIDTAVPEPTYLFAPRPGPSFEVRASRSRGFGPQCSMWPDFP